MRYRIITGTSRGLGQALVGELADAEGLYLINNAGLLEPIAAVEHLDPEAMTAHVMVNPVAPGKVDTAMQASLREHGPRDFPDRDAFVTLKGTGALNDPAAAARAVAATLDHPAITTGDVIDVRDFAS